MGFQNRKAERFHLFWIIVVFCDKSAYAIQMRSNCSHNGRSVLVAVSANEMKIMLRGGLEKILEVSMKRSLSGVEKKVPVARYRWRVGRKLGYGRKGRKLEKGEDA